MSETVNVTKVDFFDFLFANKVRKTYTNIVISLFLVFVLLVFAFLPTISKISTEKAEISNYKVLNDKLKTKVQASNDLRNQMFSPSSENEEGLKDEIEFTNQAFMYSKNIKLVFDNIARRANTNNLVLESFSPVFNNGSSSNSLSFDYSSDAPSNNFYNLSMAFHGNNLSDIKNFVDVIESAEKFPIPSRTTSVNILLPEETTGRITLNITMLVYLDATRYNVAGATL